MLLLEGGREAGDRIVASLQVPSLANSSHVKEPAERQEVGWQGQRKQLYITTVALGEPSTLHNAFSHLLSNYIPKKTLGGRQVK